MIQARWFKAFDCRTNDIAETLSKIEYLITRFDLNDRIKEICVQPLIQNQYIIYIGVLKGEFPPILQTAMPILHPKAECTVRDVIPVYSYWKNRIEGKVLYRAPEIMFDLDLDVDGGLTTHRTPEQVLTDTQQYDRLLLWLSAQGSGDYRRFRDVCKSLFPDLPDLKSSQIRKHLRLLGHIAESPDGMHWRVLPPLLVPVHTNEQTVTYTLVGARDCKLKVDLSNAVQRDNGKFYESPQLQGDGPSAWFVDTTVAEQIVDSCGVGLCNNYADCVEQLPDIDGYRTSLAKVTVSDPHYYDFRLFDGRVFQSQCFTRATGMYEIWTLPDQTQTVKRERTLFFDNNDDCWRSGDWYGLRYLHHKDRKTATCLRYDTATEELLCPDAYRLPERFEQALVIATGMLSKLTETPANRMRVFYGVPQQIAEIVARKVGATLTVN